MSKIRCLSNNMLKIIACISMVFDHVGAIIFPNIVWLRIIGRISFPIFAFLIAEGCYYTKNKLKHFLTILIFGIIIQLGEYIFANIIDLSIFAIFSLSILLIYIFDDSINNIKNNKILIGILMILLFIGIIIGLFVLTNKVPYFELSYGIYGILIPVIMFVLKKFISKYNINIYLDILVIVIAFLIKFIFTNQPLYFYSYLCIPFILLYNGKRGNLKLKYFFYFFYPIHIMIIYGIYMLISK